MDFFDKYVKEKTELEKNNRLSEQILIRVSPNELQLIDSEAKEINMKRGEFLRNLVVAYSLYGKKYLRKGE